MNEQLPKSVNEMKDILDIEGIFFSSFPGTLKIIFITLIILFVTGLIIYILKKIAQRLAKNRDALLSPEEQALKYLGALKKENFIAQGEWRSFYFLLDEIFRRYLFEKFDYDVLDRTFEELKSKLDMFKNHLKHQEIEFLNDFWGRAQMSKFAAETAQVDLAEKDFGFVRGVVERTKNLKEKENNG